MLKQKRDGKVATKMPPPGTVLPAARGAVDWPFSPFGSAKQSNPGDNPAQTSG